MSATEETNKMLTEEILSIKASYIDINNKLGILINSREHETKANDELKADVANLTKRVFEVEKVQAVNNVTFKDFIVVKNSIIRWVVGTMTAFTGLAAAIVTYMPKG